MSFSKPKFIPFIQSLSLFLILSSFFPLSAQARPGELDPAFASNGILHYRETPTINPADCPSPAPIEPQNLILAMAHGNPIPPALDGGYYLGLRHWPDGFCNNVGPGIQRIEKYYSNGAGLVSSFGPVSTPLDFGNIKEIVPLSSGKILVISEGGNLLRLHPNGLFDESFGSHGLVLNSSRGYAFSKVLPSGDVIVANDSRGEQVIVKYLSDGTRDTEFDSHIAGTQTFIASLGDPARNYFSFIKGSNDRIIFKLYDQRDRFEVFGEILANGRMNPSFGSLSVGSETYPGFQSIHLLPEEDVYDAWFVEDNKVVIYTGQNSPEGLLGGSLLRFDLNRARLDDTFGTSGRVSLSDSVVMPNEPIQKLPNGDFALLLSQRGTHVPFIQYMTPGGNLDTSYGHDEGRTLLTFPEATYDYSFDNLNSGTLAEPSWCSLLLRVHFMGSTELFKFDLGCKSGSALREAYEAGSSKDAPMIDKNSFGKDKVDASKMKAPAKEEIKNDKKENTSVVPTWIYNWIYKK